MQDHAKPADPREASVDWVRRSLSEELRDDSASVKTRAENLVAILEANQLPIDLLILWIHQPAPGKAWSGAEFRRFCELCTWGEKRGTTEIKNGA